MSIKICTIKQMIDVYNSNNKGTWKYNNSIMYKIDGLNFLNKKVENVDTFLAIALLTYKVWGGGNNISFEN